MEKDNIISDICDYTGIYRYTNEEMVSYEEFLRRLLPVTDDTIIMHMAADTTRANGIHVDTYVINGDNGTMLITMGAGSYKMENPENAPYYAEYIMCLPKNWDFNKDRWPAQVLVDTATLPVRHKTYLASGHTISEEDAKPYSDSVGYNSVIIYPFCSGSRMAYTKLSSGKRVFFYVVIPIYPEELEYKFNHGSDALMDLLAEGGGILEEMVSNINRKNHAL